MIDWLNNSRIWPWNRLSQLSHLPVSQRRQFWFYCLGEVHAGTMRDGLLSAIPSVIGIVGFWLLYGPMGPKLSAIDRLGRDEI